MPISLPKQQFRQGYALPRRPQARFAQGLLQFAIIPNLGHKRLYQFFEYNASANYIGLADSQQYMHPNQSIFALDQLLRMICSLNRIGF